MILSFLIFLLACLGLMLAGSWVLTSLTKLSSLLKISYFFLGFLLVAFATTIPEFLIGVNSALNKVPSLSLGNVLGSNIANLGLVLGILVLFKGFLTASKKGLKVENKIVEKDILYFSLLVLSPLVLLFDGVLSRFDGAVLIVLFILYLVKLIKDRQEFKAVLGQKISFSEVLINLLIFIFSVVLLIFSAKVIVDQGVFIAQELKLPLILIGLSVVAVGTSLPELVFVLKATKAKKEEMALGDLIGACALSSTLVLGVTALICPISGFDAGSYFKAAIFLILVLLVFVLETINKREIRWPAGLVLLLLYFGFISAEFFF